MIWVPSGVARAPAMGLRVSGSTTFPHAFTAEMAPTLRWPNWNARAPKPPFMAWSGPSSLPTVAPHPAPTLPSGTGLPGAQLSSAQATERMPASMSGRVKGSANARSNRQLEQTMGTMVGPTGRPMPRRSSSRAAPEAASRPKAEPPESITAWILSTVFSGFSRSVSRDAGAAPRTSTPAVAPCGATIAVQPVPAWRLVQ